MQKLLSLFFALGILATPLIAQKSVKDIGQVYLPGTNTITIQVAGTGELGTLANLAFSAHGRFTRVASGGNFSLQFSSVSPTQVRVDVTKGGASFFSETVSGSSLRNALFRAADAAVKAITGAPGFFASKLAFVGA